MFNIVGLMDGEKAFDIRKCREQAYRVCTETQKICHNNMELRDFQVLDRLRHGGGGC